MCTVWQGNEIRHNIPDLEYNIGIYTCIDPVIRSATYKKLGVICMETDEARTVIIPYIQLA